MLLHPGQAQGQRVSGFGAHWLVILGAGIFVGWLIMNAIDPGDD